MIRQDLEDLSSLSMLELFGVEAENQAAVLTSGLLALERHPGMHQPWDMLMRAAHSLKGAARIVNLQGAVRLAHALEDCFASAQQGHLQLGQNETDLMLRSVDMLLHLAKPARATAADWEIEHSEEVQRLLDSLRGLLPHGDAAERTGPSSPPPASPPRNPASRRSSKVAAELAW